MNIQLKVGRKIVFINPNEIRYIQSNNIYCNVFLNNGEQIICTSTLSKLESKLKESSCIRIHRCFIVNKTAIHTIDRSNLSINFKGSQINIPIARGRKKMVNNFAISN